MAELRGRWKEGDTDPPIESFLERYDEGTQTWLPLTGPGYMVRLLAEETRTHRRFGGVAVEDPAIPGRWAYVPLPTDLVAGDYRYEWEVTTTDGQRMSVPRDDYEQLTVLRKSGAPLPLV